MSEKYIDPYRYVDVMYNGIVGSTDTTLLDSNLAVSSPFKMLFDSINDSMFNLDAVIRGNLALSNPFLASTRQELFSHLSDRDEQYLFSTPAKAVFTLRIPLKNILESGVHDNVKDTYTLTIPKNSYVTVDNISFTLLYSITIEIVDHGTLIPYVNYDITDDTIVYGEAGYGEATIVTDSDNEEWVIFNTQFAQLSVAQYLSNAIPGSPYDATFNIADTYFYSTMEVKRNNEWVKIEKHYVDNLFELDTPSCLINIGDDDVNYKIPQNFVDSSLNGSMRTTIYTTLGKIRINMKDYTASDIKFFINSSSTNDYEAASQGLTIIASNTSIIDGGTLPVSFKNLRARIVNRATTRIDIPITEKQLSEVIRREAMVGESVADSLYGRVFLAKQETWISKKENAFPTTFMNTIDMRLYLDMQDTVNVSPSYLEFKPDTIFKQNGLVVSPLTKTDSDNLLNLSRRELIKELNNTKYFLNIYTSVIKNSDDTTEAFIYEERKPHFDKLIITNRNTFSPIKCGITTKTVTRTNNNIKIVFKLSGNPSFLDIKEQVFIQMSMNTIDGTINHTSTYYTDTDNGYYEINISLASYIKDQKLTVTNGISSGVSRLIDLSNDIKIYIYTLEQNTYLNSSLDARGYIDNSLIFTNNQTTNLLGLTKENGTFDIVQELDYIWKTASVNTLTKTYQRHTVDVPLRYEKDVYEIDSRTGSDFFINDTNNDGVCDTLTRNKLHNIGDIVLDENGDIVYKYRVGDIYLDNNGLPIESNDVNYVVNTDALMIDAKYKLINNVLFDSYLEEQKGLLDIILTEKMIAINNKLIDNTEVLFKPKNEITKVKTTDGVEYDSLVKPSIIIYYNKDITYPEIDEEVINIMIGDIIRKYLTKRYFTLKLIEDEIQSNLTDIIAVDIISFVEDRKVFSLTTKNSFFLNTTLLQSGKMVYDINVTNKYI